jgi:curved DNA-binding protein CbpA
MLEAEQYYRILDLEPGASPEEVHQGYLDLTWVWHPDRFAGHPRLQQKALYKLQELNEAHERLRSFRATSQKRDLRAKSKSQATPASQNQSPAEGLYKPQVNRAWKADDKRTIKDSTRRVSFNTRDVGEWLD